MRNKVDAFTTATLAGWKSTKMLEKYVHALRGRQVVDATFRGVTTLGPPERQSHHSITGKRRKGSKSP